MKSPKFKVGDKVIYKDAPQRDEFIVEAIASFSNEDDGYDYFLTSPTLIPRWAKGSKLVLVLRGRRL